MAKKKNRDGLYTTREVAEMFGTSPACVNRRANRYHVAVDRVVGNTNLYSSDNPKFQMLGPQSRKGRRPCKG